MRSTRAILSLRFTAVGGPSSIGRAVGGFLRYIQQRDHHKDQETSRGIDGFLRYAAHRDRTTPKGRLFGRDGDAGDHERRELGRFVTRSIDGRASGRAYYRLVISPEDARGLDLRRVTRSVMAQLERDAGKTGLPPWIAAEHRNTAHPHVHVVMAANRQLADGRYRTLIIDRERLAAMKVAMAREVWRQRAPERELDDRKPQLGRQPANRTVGGAPHRQLDLTAFLVRFLATDRSDGRHKRRSHSSPAVFGLFNFRAAARRWRAQVRRDMELEARRLGQWGRSERDDRGWER